MEKEFKIIIYSKLRFSIGLLLTIIPILPLIIMLLDYGNAGIILIVFFIIGLTLIGLFLLPRKISKAIILLIVDKDGVKIKWDKQFIGKRQKDENLCQWEDIRSYKFETSYNFNLFRIRLKDSNCFKINQWFFDSNDDFDKFLTHFKYRIKNYNSRKSTQELIQREKGIMENKKFLIFLAVLLSLILISVVVLIRVKEINNIKGLIPVLIVLGPLIWVSTIILKRIRK